MSKDAIVNYVMYLQKAGLEQEIYLQTNHDCSIIPDLSYLDVMDADLKA